MYKWDYEEAWAKAIKHEVKLELIYTNLRSKEIDKVCEIVLKRATEVLKRKRISEEEMMAKS